MVVLSAGHATWYATQAPDIMQLGYSTKASSIKVLTALLSRGCCHATPKLYTFDVANYLGAFNCACACGDAHAGEFLQVACGHYAMALLASSRDMRRQYMGISSRISTQKPKIAQMAR